jgi:hypothetical protein
MKTATLKMKTYARNANIVNNNDLDRNILRIILASFAVLALCYIVIVGNMVFNIVERKSLEVGVRTLSNDVGDLELKYLSLSNNVDLAYAQAKGFKETNIKKFTTRKTLGSISFANNEL